MPSIKGILKLFFASAIIVLCVGCGHHDNAPTDTSLAEPNSPIDALISRPDCKVQLVSDELSNDEPYKKSGIREITVVTIELVGSSKAILDQEFRTYFLPQNPFNFRVTNAPTAILSYLKSPQGILLLTADGLPVAVITAKADSQTAMLSYVDEELKRETGKGGLKLKVKSCSR